MFFFYFLMKRKNIYIFCFFGKKEKTNKNANICLYHCIQKTSCFKSPRSILLWEYTFIYKKNIKTNKHHQKPTKTNKNQNVLFFSCFFHIFSVYWWKNLFLIFFFWKKHPPFFLSLLIITWLLGVIFEYKFLFFTFRSISILYDIIWIKTILF